MKRKINKMKEFLHEKFIPSVAESYCEHLDELIQKKEVDMVNNGIAYALQIGIDHVGSEGFISYHVVRKSPAPEHSGRAYFKVEGRIR